MKYYWLFFFLVAMSGCMQSSNLVPSSTYQLITIDNKPYFLDSRNGVLFNIKKNQDGTFDISEPVGQVGLKYAL